MWDPSGPELRMPSCVHTHNPLSTCQKQACILSWLPARHAAAAAQAPEEAARPLGSQRDRAPHAPLHALTEVFQSTLECCWTSLMQYPLWLR